MLEDTVLVFDSSRRVDNLDRLSNNEQAIQQGKYYFCWNNHTPPPSPDSEIGTKVSALNIQN